MDLGPAGEHAAGAVRRFRETRRLTYAELSRSLERLGRPIPPLGLRRLESGDRRIDVDDLIALALALEVSPLAILLPAHAAQLVVSGPEYSARRIWEWGMGQWPLSGDQINAFVRDSNPLRWGELMSGRDANDAKETTLAAHTIQRDIEREQLIARRRVEETD